MTKATYRERCIGFITGKGGVEVNIHPGQFVFGRDSAAKELKMDPSTVWKRINKLKNLGNCNIESNSQYSIISIINWEIYQPIEFKSNSESNYQVTGKEQASNTNNKVKKEKNKTYTLDFEQFYAAYPKKRDPDRAWKAWQNRNGDRPEISVLLEAVKNQIQSKDWKKENGKYIPYPATWLNAGAWENEVDVEESGPFG